LPPARCSRCRCGCGSGPPLPARAAWPLHALRCALLLVALVAYFHALTLLPLVQAVAVGYTAPILISLLAMLVLHERPSRWIWAALALGAAGVGVSLWPELSHTDAPGSAQRIEGLLSVAVSASAIRAWWCWRATRPSVTRCGASCWCRTCCRPLVLAVPMAWRWQPLLPGDTGPVLLMGLLATLGLLGITWAFTHVEASRAAPVEYTGFVWAGLLGWLLFGEVPTAWTLASAGLIVTGCLLLIRR
jgi:drug/metabolite transporter (DMT)-like permease